MTIRQEIKEYQEKAKNQALGGFEFDRLVKMYQRKYKMTLDEARDEAQKAHPEVWAAYALGTPLPSGQRTTIYEI